MSRFFLLGLIFLANARAEDMSQYFSSMCVNKCDDMTISFEQPDSIGPWGYEGKCGQTATSNVMALTCNLSITPSIVDKWIKDAGPGLAPKTLAQGITKLQSWFDACPTGNWEIYRNKTAADFHLSVRYGLFFGPPNSRFLRKREDNTYVKNTPVIVLIKVPSSKALHWVTIVDVIDGSANSCNYVMNQWGGQYIVPCQRLAAWTRDASKSYPGIVRGYTLLRFQR